MTVVRRRWSALTARRATVLVCVVLLAMLGATTALVSWRLYVHEIADCRG